MKKEQQVIILRTSLFFQWKYLLIFFVVQTACPILLLYIVSIYNEKGKIKTKTGLHTSNGLYVKGCCSQLSFPSGIRYKFRKSISDCRFSVNLYVNERSSRTEHSIDSIGHFVPISVWLVNSITMTITWNRVRWVKSGYKKRIMNKYNNN